ncbi:MAG: hypothetical protein FWC41_02535 [Firmicutes bacterium]|nr:hypothetical protein [Bacillota bacterium]
MIDLNVGEMNTLLDLGNHKIVAKDDLIMAYTNDQLYFPKESAYKIINHLNREYIDHWIEKGIEFKFVKDRIDEIDPVFQTIIEDYIEEELIVFNIDDIVSIINGCENWILMMERLNDDGIPIYIE